MTREPTAWRDWFGARIDKVVEMLGVILSNPWAYLGAGFLAGMLQLQDIIKLVQGN